MTGHAILLRRLTLISTVAISALAFAIVTDIRNRSASVTLNATPVEKQQTAQRVLLVVDPSVADEYAGNAPKVNNGRQRLSMPHHRQWVDYAEKAAFQADVADLDNLAGPAIELSDVLLIGGDLDVVEADREMTSVKGGE